MEVRLSEPAIKTMDAEIDIFNIDVDREEVYSMWNPFTYGIGSEPI